ncbi:GntR family transcriptional regulator [Ruicaihuangia caeni]|uniref:GntR family transcriptional regulator n=1 Tax=Ruicaihuangia caeni TaxID=3042517 RepID=UPI0033904FA4
MPFIIDASSATPPFEQLRLQVIEQVRSGELAPGARLSPVRALAEQLGLAANTVARAYRELEADGVIETRGRAGSFIAAHGDATQQQAQLAAIAFAERMQHLGVARDDALALARAALDR